jgi:hypothetical protein
LELPFGHKHSAPWHKPVMRHVIAGVGVDSVVGRQRALMQWWGVRNPDHPAWKKWTEEYQRDVKTKVIVW